MHRAACGGMPTLLQHRDPAEAERIRRVLHAGYASEAALIGVRDFPPLRRTAAGIAASPNRFAGSFGSGLLAGVIEFGGTDGAGAVRPAIDIASLAVHPRFTRRGLGSELVRWVLGLSAGWAVTVATARCNLPAIALYEKLGFVIERSFVAAEGIECVAMRRPPGEALNGRLP